MEEYFSSHICNSACIQLGLDKSSPVEDVLTSLRRQMGKTLSALAADLAPVEEMSIVELLAELDLKKVFVTDRGEDKLVLAAQLSKARAGPVLSAAEEAQLFVETVDKAAKAMALDDEDEEEVFGMFGSYMKARPGASTKGRGPNTAAPGKPKRNNRKKTICRNMVGKGFCYRGDKCHFRHDF